MTEESRLAEAARDAGCAQRAENPARPKSVEVPSRAVRVKTCQVSGYTCQVGSTDRHLHVIGEADVSQHRECLLVASLLVPRQT